MDRHSAEAALAAFLGEAPTAAALRQPSPLRVAGSIGSATRAYSACRQALESLPGHDTLPSDSRVSSRSSSTQSIRLRASIDSSRKSLDSDRPPTPTPTSFEDTQAKSQQQCREQQRLGEQQRGTSAVENQSLREPVSLVAPATNLPASVPQRTGLAIVRSANRKPVQVRSRSCSSKASGSTANVAPSGDAGYIQASRGPAHSFDPSPADGAFFVDGVGWCDAYGRCVSGGHSSKGSMRSGDLANLEVSNHTGVCAGSKPPRAPLAPAADITMYRPPDFTASPQIEVSVRQRRGVSHSPTGSIASGSVSSSAGERVSTRRRCVSGSPKGVSTFRQPHFSSPGSQKFIVQHKLSARERDLNWDMLPGI